MKNIYKNILLIQLGDIGDVVLSIPAFQAVHEKYPDSTIIIAVREKAKELIQNLPCANGVISINQNKRPFFSEIKHQYKFFSLIRSYQFDLVFDFRTGTRGAILAFLSGARERVGFFDPEGFWRNKLFTNLYHLDYNFPQHVSDYYFSLLKAHGFNTHCDMPVIHVTDEMKKQAAGILERAKVLPELPLIAIQPFSLWSYKEWGIDKYVLLIHRILSAYRVSIILVGSNDEYERTQSIVDHFSYSSRSVVNLSGSTSLEELAAVLKSCRLMIGSDSAGMHIAAAVGTPTVIIFGPSAPDSWAPRGRHHTTVQKNMPCIPCRQKGCNDTEVSRCLDELDVNDVYNSFRSQYEQKYE